MKVFIAGATGVLGQRLVGRLVDRRHEVYGLARDDDGTALVEARGGIPRRGDVLDPESLTRAIDDVDAVIHAATSLPVTTKPTDKEWAQNDRVRLEGARNLVAAAGDTIDQFLFPSVVWVARQPDGSSFDENSDRYPSRATQSAVDVEDYLQEAAATHGFDVTVLRCGFFYAPDAAHTRQFGENLLEGKLPIIGGGLFGRQDAELTFLHADDAARAFADALDSGVTGVYHVADDQPVTVANFLATFANLLDAPEPRRIPGWLGKFFVGKETVNMLTNSMPTTSERFRQEVGWKPKYPTYQEGLQQVVKTWKNDGTLHESAEGYEWTTDQVGP